MLKNKNIYFPEKDLSSNKIKISLFFHVHSIDLLHLSY